MPSSNIKIITICGSMKFKNEMLEAYQDLSLAHNLVFLPVFMNRSIADIHEKALLKDIHIEKIEKSDIIVVVNVDGEIGEDTAYEIRRASSLGKKIVFMYQKYKLKDRYAGDPPCYDYELSDTYKQLIIPSKVVLIK